ncbi:MAG: hypothetical protein ACTHOO_01725 [Alcanivorax sp.]
MSIRDRPIPDITIATPLYRSSIYEKTRLENGQDFNLKIVKEGDFYYWKSWKNQPLFYRRFKIEERYYSLLVSLRADGFILLIHDKNFWLRGACPHFGVKLENYGQFQEYRLQGDGSYIWYEGHMGMHYPPLPDKWCSPGHIAPLEFVHGHHPSPYQKLKDWFSQ